MPLRLVESMALQRHRRDEQREVCRVRRQPERVLRRFDPLVGAADSIEGASEDVPDVEHAVVFCDEFLKQRKRFGVRALLVKGERVSKLVRDADLVLRIRQCRAAGSRLSEVPECGELSRLFGRNRSRRGGCLNQRQDRCAHGDRATALRLDEVPFLRRVGDHIVQLRLRRVNVVTVAVDQRMEIAPAEMKLREERLGVDRALRRRAGGNREQ